MRETDVYPSGYGFVRRMVFDVNEVPDGATIIPD
jgi:hypothetical protein